MKKPYLVRIREVFAQDVIVWEESEEQAYDTSCELTNTGEIDASSLSQEGQDFYRDIEVEEELDDERLAALRRLRFQEVS